MLCEFIRDVVVSSHNQSSQIEQYSLEKVHAIERELYREILQIKKELLVQVTRCTATQTIKSTYCRFQSCSGSEHYTKFHDPIVIEGWTTTATARWDCLRSTECH